GARGVDLAFGDAAVGLRDVSHHAEGGAEELLADDDRIHTRARSGAAGALLHAQVVLVAQHGAEQRAERSADEKPEGPADEFAGPRVHALAIVASACLPRPSTAPRCAGCKRFTKARCATSTPWTSARC